MYYGNCSVGLYKSMEVACNYIDCIKIKRRAWFSASTIGEGWLPENVIV